MRAVGVRTFGGPEALEVVELPEIHAGPGEVRIRAKAFTVNPTDTYVRNGARAEMLAKSGPPPYVAGMDVAGVIDEIGPGVTSVAIGDAVMAIVLPRGSHGAYCESLVLPWESVVPVPKGASFAEASTVPMNALTARLSLDLLGLPRGASLAVTGAAGCYGGYTVQLARADGLRVIADASARDESLVGDLGADVVVERGDDVAARIRAVVADGVDGLADGSVQNGLLLAAIRDDGGFATVRGWQGPAERGITIHPVLVSSYGKNHAALDRIRQQIERGEVTMRVARTFAPAEAGEAHRQLEAGGTRGRLVIDWTLG